MAREERFVKISRDEFSLVIQDLHSARREIEVLRRAVCNAKTRHVDAVTGAFMWTGVFVPVLNDWPWYLDVSFFFGCLFVVTQWGHLFSGIRDRETEWPEERVYERNEWYDWAPQDKPPGW